MELAVQTLDEKTTSEKLKVSETVFDRPYNEALIHQIVTAYLAGARQGTKAQKNRAAVAGGGAKPWRQKGTGRARAGTRSSPIWRSGGATFAAQPRDYRQIVNKKMYRAGMQSILSELQRQQRLIIVKNLQLETPKTKQLIATLKKLKLDDVLIVIEAVDENLFLAARNIPKVNIIDIMAIEPVSLVGHEKVLITEGAIKQLEKQLAA